MPIFGIELDSAGQQVFAAIGRLGLEVVSWRVDALAKEPTAVARMKNAFLSPVPIAELGGEFIAIGDGVDLLFVPRDAPGKATRRAGHDEPIKRLVAGANLIASVACWFEDTQVDQMRLWTTDGQPLGPVTLPEHVADMVICPDGSSMLALGYSGALWCVTLRIEDWMATARRIAGRNLTAEEERRYGVDVWQARGRTTAAPV